MGCGMIGGWLTIIVIGLGLYFILKDKKDLFSTQNNAQTILDERYAKGEIDEKEYKERSENLKSIK